MSSGDLKRAKRDVRRRVLALRDAMDADDRARAAADVTRRVLGLPEVEAASTVLAFSSFGSELPMLPLIEALVARGMRVGLPVITGDEIVARAWRPGEPTTTTSFGAEEPAGGAPIDPVSIDVIVTPAVAVDRAGRRVGYGGGFYDRFLPRTRAGAARVAVVLAVQLVDDDLPAGSFDLPVDVIVTPDEVIRCER
ncbi:MAG: 5-formyltetrahydrofolate cyclo-ligase [Actinomycetota bacterium]